MSEIDLNIALEDIPNLPFEQLKQLYGYLIGGCVKSSRREFYILRVTHRLQELRFGDVGVFSGEKIVHLGAKPEFVPKLIKDLFDWAKKSDAHPLIKSSVIHFEIEFIHPFADGNGRIGRLWQTLVLSKWYEIFAWLPVETIVYENQAEYYAVLGRAEQTADSTEFIEFMLEAITKALAELPIGKITELITEKNTDKLSKTELEFLHGIIGYLENNGKIDNYHAQLLIGKSAVSAKKYFAKLVEAGILTAIGTTKARKYKLNKEEKEDRDEYNLS